MRLFFTLLFLYLCSYSNLSSAAVTCTAASSSISFNIPVTVYPDTPAGTELGSQTMSYPSLFTCSYFDNEAPYYPQSILLGTSWLPWDQTVNNMQIYPTSATGIGYTIGIYIPNCGKTDITWLNTSNGSTSVTGCSQPNMIGRQIPVDLTFKLFKTESNVTIGTSGSGRTLGWVQTNINNSKMADIGLYLVDFTVTQASCMVINRTIDVTLDPISRFAFTGQGTTQGSKNFNISVKCLENTAVKLQIDGTNIYDASQGVLAEASGNNIGVGIQVRYNGSPVYLGTPFPVGTANPTLDIPLEARYYQTAATVQPGAVSAFATFTMTYN